MFLITMPFTILFDSVGVFWDQRYLYLPAFLATLAIVPLLARRPDQKLALVAAIALNPQLFPFVIEGRNDFFVLLWFFAGVVLLAREKRTLLGVLIEAGLASSAGGLADMLAGVERATARESLRLGNRVANLARLGGALILVGLLGTVMDLLSTANVLMILLEPTWSDFVIGFSEALSCTGFGLFGALLCFAAYFWLESRLVQQTLAVSEIAEELMREAARRS